MSGAILTTIGEAGGGGAGGTLGPLSWSNIFDSGFGKTNTQTIAVTGTVSIAGALSAGGVLSYAHNGTFRANSGAFAVANGDTLWWGVQNTGSTSVIGTVTVTDVTHGLTVASFTYHVTPP